MSVENEAIQVAAVAAALVEDLATVARRPPPARGGRVGPRWWDPGPLVLGMIHDERKRQVAKWGVQHHRCREWLMVLAEEVGELAAAVTEREPEDDDGEARAVEQALIELGGRARRWIVGHPWPPRQQGVIDREK